MEDLEKRSLMRTIWDKNRDTERIRTSAHPWLVQHVTEPHPTETDVYGNPKPVTLEVDFEKYRTVPRWEHYHRFRQSIEHLYWKAVSARGKATSYRDFDVGCAVLAAKGGGPYSEPSWEVHLGMNTKVSRDARPVCAEPIAISSAYAAGCSWIVGIVVLGYRREEDIDIKTLHPCRECRNFMSEYPIVDNDPLVLPAEPPEGMSTIPGPHEVRNVKRLLQLHQHDDYDHR